MNFSGCPEVRVAYLIALLQGEIDDNSSISSKESNNDSSSLSFNEFEVVGNTVLNSDHDDELLFHYES